jgi:hypothetical protein
MIGRYGRIGTLRGRIDDCVADAQWSEPARFGWIKLRFDAEYICCKIRYGLNHLQRETGRCSMLRITRRARRLPKADS